METIEVGKLQTISLSSAIVMREGVAVPNEWSNYPILDSVIRLSYGGRLLDQIEYGSDYFFDVLSGDVVKVEF